MATALETIRTRIAEACERSGRSVGEVRLVGVTKYQPGDAVRAAIDAGLTELGENFPQALAERMTTFPDAALRWHAIGPLQTNKARLLDGAAAFHALDRIRVADVLGRRRDGDNPLDCFVRARR